VKAIPHIRFQPVIVLRAAICAVLVQLAVTGCGINGDFGRPRPSLVSDNMHSWVGRDAAISKGIEPSNYPLTDDERTLRDLAFPMIEPPYDRNRWYSVLNEYGLNRANEPNWHSHDTQSYSRELMTTAYRSATARYAKISDDIRDDIARISPFYMTANRVLDIDIKRDKSLAFVRLPEGDGNAKAREAENALVISWVQKSLADRVESYRVALGRLVIETPAPMAVEVERAIGLLKQQIAEHHIDIRPQFQRRQRSASAG
jgi:hypothetical protein